MAKGEIYQQFTIPRRCYPRCDYLSKYTKSQLASFRDILKSLHVAEHVSQLSFEDVSVVSISTNKKDCLNASDIALKHTETVKYKTLNFEEANRVFDSVKPRDTLIVIAPTHYRKIPTFLEPFVLFIEEPKHGVPSARKKRKLSTESTQSIVSRSDLAENISKILERQVLGGFDDRLSILKWIMEFDTTTSDHGSESVNCTTILKGSSNHLRPKRSPNVFLEEKVSGSKKLKATACSGTRQKNNGSLGTNFSITPSSTSTLDSEKSGGSKDRRHSKSKLIRGKHKMPAKVEIRLLYSRNTSSSEENVKPMTRRAYASSETTGVDETISHLQEQLLQCSSDQVRTTKEAAELLYGEMKGMLHRSGVPLSDFKHADVDMIKVLDKQSAKEILSIKGVIRVGYRFRTLNIYMDDSLGLKYKKKREEEIESILSKRSIMKYAFFYESRQIKMFREVGATIRSCARGTLGGFVQFGPNRDLCILLAGHLASQNKNISLQIESNPPKWKPFATVLQPQTENLPGQVKIDIAIAKVISSESQNCMTKFKDETGNHLPSIMKRFARKSEESLWLSGLFVHIWGAASKPGLGKVIIPELYHKDGMPPSIEIEDRNAVDDEGEHRFADAGDSGAVVCANDIDGKNVYAQAMVMGSPYSQDDDDHSRCKNTIACKLKEGLEFLEGQHDGQIRLFKCSVKVVKTANDIRMTYTRTRRQVYVFRSQKV